MRAEEPHVHAAEVIRIAPHAVGDFGLGDRQRHRPGRVQINRGDVSSQRRRGPIDLADDHTVTPLHRATCDRFHKGGRNVHDDIALGKQEIHAA